MLTAPKGPGDSEEQRREVAERTARRDFACDDAKVIVALLSSETDGHPWQPLVENTSGRPRYVVEGCGQRGLYVESCAFADDGTEKGAAPADAASSRVYECRYLLVSVVPMHGASQGTAAAAAQSTPAPATAPGVAGDAGTEGATSL